MIHFTAQLKKSTGYVALFASIVYLTAAPVLAYDDFTPLKSVMNSTVSQSVVPTQQNLATSQQYLAQGFAPLQGYVVTVPAGTYAQAALQAPLSSETARAGDRFNVTLSSPLMSGGAVALPAGTMIEGQVISVTTAGRAGRNGQLDVRFTSALSPSGQRIPLSARLQTEDGTGILKGGTGKSRALNATKRAAGGAAAGALFGTVMGALSGGEVGRGAVYGTAVGSGLGAAYAGIKKGVEAMLPAGQPVNIVLDAPVTTSPNGGTMAPQQQAMPYGNQGGYTTQNGNYSYNSSTNQPSYNPPQKNYSNNAYGQQPAQNYQQPDPSYYGQQQQVPQSTYTTQPTNPYGY